ncbi:hypothetical protein ACO0QE_002471 [Hanseniaspora vineae]
MLQLLESLKLPNSEDCCSTSLAISPDGKYLATVINTYQVIVYQLNHIDQADITDSDNSLNKYIQKLKKFTTDHSKGINSLTWSPDNQCIATCSDDCSIEIYHMSFGKLQTLMGHTAPVITIKYSPKGNLLFSGSMDESIKIWNISSSGIIQHEPSFQNLDEQDTAGKNAAHSLLLLTPPMKTMSAHSDPVVTLDIPRFDSSIIASGSYDGLIRIFDTKSGHCLKTLTYDKDWANDGVLPIINVKFSYNGKYLLVKSMDGVLKLWNFITGKVMRTFVESFTENLNGEPMDVDMADAQNSSSNLDSRTLEHSTKGQIEDDANESDDETSLAGRHCTGMEFLYTETGTPLLVDGTETGDLIVYDVNSKKILLKRKLSTSCVIDVQVHRQLVCALTLNGELELFHWSAGFDETH